MIDMLMSCHQFVFESQIYCSRLQHVWRFFGNNALNKRNISVLNPDSNFPGSSEMVCNPSGSKNVKNEFSVAKVSGAVLPRFTSPSVYIEFEFS